MMRGEGSGVRMTRRLFLLACMAGSAATTAPSLAQSVSPDPTLVIGLMPQMERGRDELSAIVAQSGVARVGNDSDFNLSTDPWIPSFVFLTRSDAKPSDDVGTARSAIRLGSLTTGEAQRALAAFLPRAARGTTLLKALKARPAATIALCMLMSDGKQCDQPGNLLIAGFNQAARLRNEARTAQFVAALLVTDDQAITLLPVRGANVIRLAPGERIDIDFGIDEDSVGGTLVAISSERPFDPETLRQPAFTATDGGPCAGSGSACPDPRKLALAGGWQGSMIKVVSLDGSDEPQPAMGGGMAVGGSYAPWMVALYDPVPFGKTERELDAAKPLLQQQFLEEKTPEERAHACGGALIEENIVLTAAHCVAAGQFEGNSKALAFKLRRVRLGTHQLGRGGETRAIVGMAVHAGYNGKATGQPNDIALLLLKRDDRVHYTPPPLAIGTKPVADRSVVDGLGWGYTRATAGQTRINVNMAADGTAQRNPIALQVAPLEKMPFADCVRSMGPQVKPGMLCLVTPKKRREAGGEETFSCRGDSGGPLVRSLGRDEEIVGLTSWSRGCGAGAPSVYTDVTYFAPWIAAARAQLVAGKAITVPEPARAPRATRRN